MFGVLLHFFRKGLPDARAILPSPACRWEDMGNTMAQEKGPQAATEVGPPQLPDVPDGPKDDPDSTTKEAQLPFDHVRSGKQKKRSCCAWWCDALFVILSIVTLLKALAEICVSVSGAISTRLFSTEQSGRMVGMVLLALLAAVTISILIYALIAVFKKQAKPLHAAALVLLITAVLQAVVVGMAVRNSPHDRTVLERSMRESFELARENPRHEQLWAATQHDAAVVLLITAGLQAVVVGMAVRNSPHDRTVLERSMRESFELARENPRHEQLWAATQHDAAVVLLITAVLQAVVVGMAVRNSPHDRTVLERSMQESFELARENQRHEQLWAATQHDLTCCGLDSPYDYRSKNLPDIFPPNVPIACCLSYDPSRSDLVQERDRETCKARRTYYTEGCREAIFDVVKTTSDLVLGITISLMILEIILSILAAVLHKRNKKRKTPEKEESQP